MSTAVTTTEQPNLPAWRRRLEANMPQIAGSLPDSVRPEKFQRVAATALARTPMLQECMESNPKAVLLALTDCAADGLMPNGKEAALVPFNDRKNNRIDLTYIPMISGVLKRMRNSGEVTSISAEIVHENDVFEFIRGDEECLTHKPNWQSDRGEPVAAYAIIRMASGEIYREVMAKAQIMAVKNASRAKGGPWSGPFELEMWRKTVLKRAAKYCPLSDERVQTMLDRDNSLYSFDQPAIPTPAESRFKQIRQAQARPTYGRNQDEDEVPARDINEDQETAPEHTTLQSGAQVEEEGEHNPPREGEADMDSQANPPSSPPDNVETDSPSAYYFDTLNRLKKAKPAERKKIIGAAELSDEWQELTSGKQQALRNAAKE